MMLLTKLILFPILHKKRRLSHMKDSDLDFWIKNDLNVLFIGRHGVGKTSIIIQAMQRNNLSYAYFSAPTMDPWVDFIGVPKERIDQNGSPFLDLVKPALFANDQINAIIFDEFNRAPKKIKNAAMELIQFKSINGKKFNNLHIVWAAINPDDDESLEYDVEKLDPAQKDRFHIIQEIPYSPDAGYFKSKYGDNGLFAIDWWNKLPDEIKSLVSPRRLDYAMNVHSIGGNIRNVLPKQTNASQLIARLSIGNVQNKLSSLLSADDNTLISIFSNDNFIHTTINYIEKSQNFMNKFIPFFPKEKLVSIMVTNPKILKHCLNNYQIFNPILHTLVNVKNKNPIIIAKIKKCIESNKPKPSPTPIPKLTNYTPIDTYFTNTALNVEPTDDSESINSRFIDSQTVEYKSNGTKMRVSINCNISYDYYLETVKIFNSNHMNYTEDYVANRHVDFIKRLDREFFCMRIKLQSPISGSCNTQERIKILKLCNKLFPPKPTMDVTNTALDVMYFIINHTRPSKIEALFSNFPIINYILYHAVRHGLAIEHFVNIMNYKIKKSDTKTSYYFFIPLSNKSYE